MELAALVAVALLTRAEGAEVLGGLGDDVVEELEVDAAGAGCHMPMSAAVHLSSIGHHQAIGEVCSGGGRRWLTLLSLVQGGDLAAGIALGLWTGPGAVAVVVHQPLSSPSAVREGGGTHK